LGGFFFDAIRRKKIYSRNGQTDSINRISQGKDKKIKIAVEPPPSGAGGSL
jgi:hypothetical protein